MEHFLLLILIRLIIEGSESGLQLHEQMRIFQLISCLSVRSRLLVGRYVARRYSQRRDGGRNQAY